MIDCHETAVNGGERVVVGDRQLRQAQGECVQRDEGKGDLSRRAMVGGRGREEREEGGVELY